MRTHNSIERLAVAGRPLLADAEALVDAGEREQILTRIVQFERRPVRRRPMAIALVGAVVVGAAVAAVAIDRHTVPRVSAPTGHHQAALTGARIQMAGYHFKTPAGFKASDASCTATASTGKPVTVMNGFAAAASADGGCVEAFFLIAGSPNAQTPNPPPGDPVDVGSYQGYYDPQGDGGANLYVELPQGDARPVFLVLFAQNLTEDQLIAVAQSGLPSGQPTTPGSVTGP